MFSQPVVYGFNGIDSTSLNRMIDAGRFLFMHRARLDKLVAADGDFKLNWLLMKVISSSVLSSNRWTYTLDPHVPQAALAGSTLSPGSAFASSTGYNIAEFGNTSGTAGGVDAIRAAGLGFTMQAIPTGTLVHAFQLCDTTGGQIMLFERANAWDGECPGSASLIETIDGGIYGVS
jgi:hypothetical protein